MFLLEMILQIIGHGSKASELSINKRDEADVVKSYEETRPTISTSHTNTRNRSLEDMEDDYYKELNRMQVKLRSSSEPFMGISSVLPKMIDPSFRYSGLFGEANMESGAEKIVRLLQLDNEWRHFMVEELGNDAKHEIRTLIDYGWIVQLSGSLSDIHPYGLRPNEKFAVTKNFIDRCSRRMIS